MNISGENEFLYNVEKRYAIQFLIVFREERSIQVHTISVFFSLQLSFH